MRAKAIIFDLDGTLYDNRPLLFLVPMFNLPHLNLVLAERTARKELAGLWLGTRDKVFEKLFGLMQSRTGVSAQKAERWFQRSYLPSQAKIVSTICRKRKWVDKALKELRADGCKLVCFSDYGFAEEKLKALDINPEAFDLVTDAATLGGFKPCRESFLSISRQIGIPPRETLVIGDREDADGAGAASAGMHYLRLTSEMSRGLMSSGSFPDLIIDSIPAK